MIDSSPPACTKSRPLPKMNVTHSRGSASVGGPANPPHLRRPPAPRALAPPARRPPPAQPRRRPPRLARTATARGRQTRGICRRPRRRRQRPPPPPTGHPRGPCSRKQGPPRQPTSAARVAFNDGREQVRRVPTGETSAVGGAATHPWHPPPPPNRGELGRAGGPPWVPPPPPSPPPFSTRVWQKKAGHAGGMLKNPA